MTQRFVNVSLIALSLVLIVRPAWPSFVSNPNRIESREFTKFYLTRFDPWFRKNVFDYSKVLSPSELKFVEKQLSNPQSFTTRAPQGLVRHIDYSIRFSEGRSSIGPIRFVLDESAERELAGILKARGVVPKIPNLIGIGFFADKSLVQAIHKGGEGELIAITFKGKVDSKSEVIKIGAGLRTNCVASSSISQVDLVTVVNGETYHACHPDLFEERALPLPGQKLVTEFRRGLNIVPGVVKWKSPQDYELIYP